MFTCKPSEKSEENFINFEEKNGSNLFQHWINKNKSMML